MKGGSQIKAIVPMPAKSTTANIIITCLNRIRITLAYQLLSGPNIHCFAPVPLSPA